MMMVMTMTTMTMTMEMVMVKNMMVNTAVNTLSIDANYEEKSHDGSAMKTAKTLMVMTKVALPMLAVIRRWWLQVL